MSRAYNHEDVEALREALVGRSVVSSERPRPGEAGEVYYRSTEAVLRLDNGQVLKLAGNDGGCSCRGGDYDLSHLNEMPINGIMDVQVEEAEQDYEITYRIFVLAQDERIELASFEGHDGSGYYGTGFWFTIEDPS